MLAQSRSRSKARVPHIYIVTDCEFDGPVPGRHSMLSFASVALSEAGKALGEFEAVLAPLEGAGRDPVTMAFWQAHPQALAAASENPQPAADVMARFVSWVSSFGAEPVFAAHPVALDAPWIDHYLKRFTGRPLFEGPWIGDRLFRHPPLCILSLVAGATGRKPWECDIRHYPAEWLGNVEHTHRAIDDARGYANLLHFFLTRREGGGYRPLLS
jgi:hypothetical protein